MYPRTNYEMTEVDLTKLKDACKPVPYMIIGGVAPRSPQENANEAWAELGRRLGFDHMTVRPDDRRGERFFTAIPSETPEQRQDRMAQEAEEKRLDEIATLKMEIALRQERLKTLSNNSPHARGSVAPARNQRPRARGQPAL
jgi:hypothetical protein